MFHLDKMTSFLKESLLKIKNYKIFKAPTLFRGGFVFAGIVLESILLWYSVQFLYKTFSDLAFVIFASIFYWTTLLFIKDFERFLLFLILFLFPFNRFLILRSEQAYLLGRISDYLLITIQLFEIPLFTLVAWRILQFFIQFRKVNKELIFSREKLRYIFAFVTISLYIVVNVVSKNSLFISISGLNLLVDFLLIFLLFQKFTIDEFKKTFYISALIQACVSILQVIVNSSIGLYFLGESKFNSGLYYISKTVLSGTLRVRAYGTFPHPNLLAGFLFIAIIIVVYDLLKEISAKQRFIANFQHVGKIMILSFALLALYLTQSRTTIGALVISIILSVVYVLFKKTRNKKVWFLSLSGVLFLSGLLIIIFRERILSLFTYDRTSIQDRLELAKVSFESIKNSPIWGNVYGGYLRGLSKFGAIRTKQSFIVEPVHNVFLLLAADFGVLGVFSILTLLGTRIWRFSKKNFSIPYSFVQISILCFLFLSLNLDHYLVTLKQGVVLFAISLILLK